MPRELPYLGHEKFSRWEEDREWVVDLASSGQFKHISPHGFKVLKFDVKHVNVMHYSREGCSGTFLSSSRRSTLFTFFGLFRDRQGGILKMKEDRAYVIGCEYGAVSGVFAMMQWWCDGLHAVPNYEESRMFVGVFQLHDAALMLKVPDAMLKFIEDRLDEIRELEIPEIEDLVAVYENFSKDHVARRYTLEAWTTAYVGGETDVEKIISDLFMHQPELLQDVNDAIAEEQERRYVSRYQDDEMDDGEGNGEATNSSGIAIAGWEGVTLPLR